MITFYRYRSAITGRFVSAAVARRRPRTTVSERVTRPSPAPRALAAARRRVAVGASGRLRAHLRGR